MIKCHFNHIRIAGFRRLRNVDIDMRPLCVLIGANGVGKTSFLDVMALLAASAEGKLNAFVTEMGGLSTMITYDYAQSLDISISMQAEEFKPLVYDFSITPTRLAYTFKREILTQRQNARVNDQFNHIDSTNGDIKYYELGTKKLVRPNWEHNPLESSLSQVPKMFKDPELFRRALSSSIYYHILDVAPRSPVRLPQTMRPAGLPGQDGEDMVTCLYYLRETERDRFDAVEDTLKAAFPAFERLDFPPVAAGTITMAWKDRHFSRPMYAHQLSEGTLRFLWLVTLLQSPQLPAVTMIDEPEVSLHPDMLRMLAGLLREASDRTQLIVATHSDRFVRFLQPSELIAMDISDEGNATMTWADSLDLEKWMAEYSLDELWQMGRLGGRS
jgi:predicted ATPase